MSGIWRRIRPYAMASPLRAKPQGRHDPPGSPLNSGRSRRLSLNAGQWAAERPASFEAIEPAALILAGRETSSARRGVSRRSGGPCRLLAEHLAPFPHPGDRVSHSGNVHSLAPDSQPQGHIHVSDPRPGRCNNTSGAPQPAPYAAPKNADVEDKRCGLQSARAGC
jgi:hypothetical protein